MVDDGDGFQSVTYTDEHGMKKLGYFFEKYDSREACEAGTQKLISSLPNKELIGGYRIVYSDQFQTYFGELLDKDGNLFEDISRLFK